MSHLFHNALKKGIFQAWKNAMNSQQAMSVLTPSWKQWKQESCTSSDEPGLAKNAGIKCPVGK